MTSDKEDSKEEEEDVSEFQVKLRKKPQEPDEEPGRPRAPANTLLFLSWLESNKIVEFSTSEFIFAVKYPSITNEAADKVILYQLQQGKLQQMGKDRFIVRKKGE